MKFAINKSELAKMIEQRNGYLVLAGGLLFLCMILGIAVFSLVGREKIIVVPPTINKSFWVSNSAVSEEYLSEMTTFFAYLRLNIPSDNIAYQHDMLLHYTDPSYYGELKNRLVAESDHITREHISTAFYPINIQVDAKHLKAIIIGDLNSTVGEDHLPNHEVGYEVCYRYDSGKLLVKEFNEVKLHD